MHKTLLIVSLFTFIAYIWWPKETKEVAIALPSEEQKKEMTGTSNTPNIPLTPIQS